jgi:hypothetical protein
MSTPLEPVPDGVCAFHEKELDQYFAADIEDQANVDCCPARSESTEVKTGLQNRSSSDECDGESV